ncbi:MAG: type II secretion system protein J [Chthoniobacteraceae bacterium]
MKSRAIHNWSGFTLIEILAAISILMILAIIIVQITSTITHTTKLSNRAIDAAMQARLAFDRIGLDLEGLVKRSDTDFLAQNAASGTNTSLLLFISSVTSPASSPSNNRGLSIIAYQVNVHADNNGLPCLIRSGQSIPWSNAGGTLSCAGFMGLQPNGLPLSFSSSAFDAFLPKTADFDVLAEGVIRMVIGFQLYPDNLAVTLADGTTIDNARGQIVYSPPIRALTPSGGGAAVNYIDLSRISALVIGLVALDLPTLRLLSASQIATLGNAFPVPANKLSPLRAWGSKAEQAASDPSFSTIPLPARQAVRVFERSYPVTPFATQAL